MSSTISWDGRRRMNDWVQVMTSGRGISAPLSVMDLLRAAVRRVGPVEPVEGFLDGVGVQAGGAFGQAAGGRQQVAAVFDVVAVRFMRPVPGAAELHPAGVGDFGAAHADP